MNKNATDKELIMETVVLLKVLTERVDKHSVRYEAQFNKINALLSDIKEFQLSCRLNMNDRIHTVEIKQLKGDSKLGKKIAGISGVVGVVAGVIGALIGRLVL